MKLIRVNSDYYRMEADKDNFSVEVTYLRLALPVYRFTKCTSCTITNNGYVSVHYLDSSDFIRMAIIPFCDILCVTVVEGA